MITMFVLCIDQFYYFDLGTSLIFSKWQRRFLTDRQARRLKGTARQDLKRQGSHKLWKSWKTWKITKRSSMHGEIMEFEKNP